ncbi:MAG TPA: hypothetical protein VHR45_12215 [Thermoanaerobaculia bacterium]|nr:hypothetical protein [Thermoanaerobaculia bacterium]
MSDERKYRQRGYQDSDRGARPARGTPPAPREKREGPRGRGLGAPTESVFRCNACGEKRTVSTDSASAAYLGTDATCGRCGADLHTCTNCVHFDTGSRWECRQFAAIPERIAKKSARNCCPVFAPKTVQEFGADRDHPTDPRAAFDALFKL